MKRRRETNARRSRQAESESDGDMSEKEHMTKRQLVAQSQPTPQHDDTEEDEMTGGLDFTQTDYAEQITQIDASTQDKDEAAAAKSKSSAMSTRIGQMAPKVIEELTALLVRYMLYKASLKLPIKFGDISKDVFPKYKNVSRYFFERAKEQLKKVFGYRVVQVDDVASKEVYLILNNAMSQEHLLLMNKTGKSSSRGLLMMVLGLLWCAPGRRLSEDDLWKQLALVDSAVKQNREHPKLGDIAGLIKTFETQLYLQTTSELDADLKKGKFYSYGARALVEVGKVQIFNFVCKLITSRPPTDLQLDELALEDQYNRLAAMDAIAAAYDSSSSSSDESPPSPFPDERVGTKRRRAEDDADGDTPQQWVRAFPHVAGNWPSHIKFTIEPCAALRELCADAIAHAQAKATDFTLVAEDTPFHLSLSRPFVLTRERIEPFVDELRAALKWRHRFALTLHDPLVLVNDDKTRSFLALRVVDGEDSFLQTLCCVDKCMKRFNLPLYYEEPIPHVSIASALGSALANQLLPDLLHEFKAASTAWRTVLTAVDVVIGNKHYHIALQ